MSYKLCYVDGAFAYFTKLELKDQWGDDWDDAPYEHNAGPPSSETPDQIIKIAFDSNGLEQPKDFGGINSPWSVEQINKGAVAWLSDRWAGSKVVIPAGTTIEDFEVLVKKAGGSIYKEVKNG